MLHSDLEALIGSTIHERYEVESLLGAGGMGAVFKARHTGLQRGVAIKVLHPEIGRDESVSKRFDREAHSASRLDHPNCVRVTDFGTTQNGTKYLVMELLEGGDLDGRLGKPWEPDRAVATIRQVLYGLEHAHAVGIVHRDLKPENIFVTRDFKGEEVVKIVDFGIAKLIDEQGSEKLTRQGIVFGTPRYMSPEQAAGGKIDERTDLYAVGLILYELLAGHGPFQTDDAAQLLRMQIMAPPPPLPASVPPALARVVEKLLEKSKIDRFASAREVLDALDQSLAGVQAAAAPIVASAPVAASTGSMSNVAGSTGSMSNVAATAPLAAVSAPASSGAAWQPAEASPSPAVSGVTVAAPAAELAAASMSVGSSGSAHPGFASTGAYASVGQAATGPFPTVPTGSHPSLASGSHPHASESFAPTVATSQPGMTVGEPTSSGSKRVLPIALAVVVLIAVFAGIGMFVSSLGDDERQQPGTNQPEPAAVAGTERPVDEPAAGDTPSEQPEPQSQAGQPDSAVAPGPVRKPDASPSWPVRPTNNQDSKSESGSKSGADTSPAPSPSPKPSDGKTNGGSTDPTAPSDSTQPSDPSTEPSTDPAGNPTGVDPREAEEQREAAADQAKRESEAQREKGKGNDKGKGKKSKDD